MSANHLRSQLDSSWEITVVDRDDDHHYQPGYLFVAFWMKPSRLVRSRKKLLKDGISFIESAVSRVRPGEKSVELVDGATLNYDWLVIASGTRPDPTLVTGMVEAMESSDAVHEFYTLEGATALKKKLAGFKEGRILVHVSEMPIKCPVAPLRSWSRTTSAERASATKSISPSSRHLTVRSRNRSRRENSGACSRIDRFD